MISKNTKELLRQRAILAATLTEEELEQSYRYTAAAKKLLYGDKKPLTTEEHNRVWIAAYGLAEDLPEGVPTAGKVPQ